MGAGLHRGSDAAGTPGDALSEPGARTVDSGTVDSGTVDSGTVARLRAAGCVFAEDEAALLHEATADPAELDALIERRVVGEPLEQVLGWAAFDGQRFVVEPGVFVPRHRTELMVREAVAIGSARPDPMIVDLCCGCGAVGVAVRLRLGRGTLVSTDVEAAAVRCAARNVELVGGTVARGDLFEALPPGLRGRVDVLVANVPYVPTDAVPLMPPEARLHELRSALDGGPDGLRLFARVAADAPLWLAAGGSVLLETAAAQVPEALRLLEQAGLAARVVTDDDHEAIVVVGSA